MMTPERAVVLTEHSHCDYCGEAMPHAIYGQRFCSPACRVEGKAQEQRVARQLWRRAGRPMIEDEQQQQERR
jgi:predicted nucleic acid-binding Zn ribbon protein